MTDTRESLGLPYFRERGAGQIGEVANAVGGIAQTVPQKLREPLLCSHDDPRRAQMTRFHTPDVSGQFWQDARFALGISVAIGLLCTVPAIFDHAMTWGLG